MAKADILVDYHGTGTMQSAFHPYAKVTTIFGRIPLPEINIEREKIYEYQFTLPESIQNPFLQVVGIMNVSYSFLPINEAAGIWKLQMLGKFIRYKQKVLQYEQFAIEYTNPVTRSPFPAYIVYGGFRG
ncbi:hypothetical protein [Acinetobacter nosocomialis]|uniref:hypothetical protein n=1 Tax=Acinetobacter nosocomialis TaxID=106654 RepID=UPI0024DE4C9E|nr:hypothetical protein [Acinetobacter nosocomialis]MDM9637151.1 hypothetical protein [Acinetobacter nosocomialis]MDX7880105.1 hypothetical protein [Acinetobacter nosocomialis]